MKNIKKKLIQSYNLKSNEAVGTAFASIILTDMVNIYLSTKYPKAKPLRFFKNRKRIIVFIKALKAFVFTLLYYEILDRFLKAISPALKKFYLLILNRLPKW